MTYRVTFFLPYPASTVTRYTHTTHNLADARALAERVYHAHRQHGPVTILNDVGEVVESLQTTPDNRLEFWTTEGTHETR